MIQISHDPVARLSVVRRREKAPQKLCRWCGSPRKSLVLFRYGIQPDSLSGRVEWDGHLFCSKSCRDSYCR